MSKIVQIVPTNKDLYFAYTPSPGQLHVYKVEYLTLYNDGKTGVLVDDGCRHGVHKCDKRTLLFSSRQNYEEWKDTSIHFGIEVIEHNFTSMKNALRN